MNIFSELLGGGGGFPRAKQLFCIKYRAHWWQSVLVSLVFELGVMAH